MHRVEKEKTLFDRSCLEISSALLVKQVELYSDLDMAHVAPKRHRVTPTALPFTKHASGESPLRFP